MRNPGLQLRVLVKHCVMAAALAFTLMGAGVADAGRPRILPTQRHAPTTTPNPSPTTPEPSAALIFGLGLGAVSWASRRTRR